MIELLPEAIGVGLVLILGFGELFGITAGGLVVPGYLATQLDRPWLIITTLVIGGLALVVVRLLGRVTLLYGRRRFVVTILIGFLFGLLAEHGIDVEVTAGEARSIGFILPGLIANTMESQGVVVTLGALVILTVTTRLVLVALFGATMPF